MRQAIRATCAVTGGNHVLYDHHVRPGEIGAFDQPPCAVTLGFLAHQEAVERLAGEEAHHRRRRHQRIGAQAHASDGAGLGGDLIDHGAEQLADEEVALGVEADAATVDVEVGALSGREHHLALLERERAQELEQALALARHAGLVEQRQGGHRRGR